MRLYTHRSPPFLCKQPDVSQCFRCAAWCCVFCIEEHVVGVAEEPPQARIERQVLKFLGQRPSKWAYHVDRDPRMVPELLQHRCPRGVASLHSEEVSLECDDRPWVWPLGGLPLLWRLRRLSWAGDAEPEAAQAENKMASKSLPTRIVVLHNLTHTVGGGAAHHGGAPRASEGDLKSGSPPTLASDRTLSLTSMPRGGPMQMRLRSMASAQPSPSRSVAGSKP